MHFSNLLNLYKIDDHEEQNIKKWPWSTMREEKIAKITKAQF